MPLSVSQYSSPDTKPFNLELHLTYANSHCLSLCCWFKGTVHHNIDIFPLTCSAIYSSRLFELPIDVRLVALKGPKDISKNLNSKSLSRNHDRIAHDNPENLLQALSCVFSLCSVQKEVCIYSCTRG